MGDGPIARFPVAKNSRKTKNVGIHPGLLWNLNSKFQFERLKDVHASCREATVTENLLQVRLHGYSINIFHQILQIKSGTVKVLNVASLFH